MGLLCIQRKTVIAFLSSIAILSGYPVLLAPLPSAYALDASDCRTYNSSSKTITVTCDATWTEIAATFPSGSATVKDQGDGEYIVNANIAVSNGKRLTIEPGTWLKITGQYGLIIYGYLDASSAKITSWSESSHSVIDNGGSGPRAYVRYRAGDGGTIKDSKLAFLGFRNCLDCSYKRGISLETYGGGGTHDVIMRDNVFHHNYYAFYSNSAYNIVLDSNEWHSNHQYNIDPHTGTHNMQITNNNLHDSYGTAIICSFDCYDILIEGNKIHDFTSGNKVGISFSRNMHDSIARNNEITNMATGIFVSESPGNEIYGNTIKGVTRGIYFVNPTNADDGVTRNNYAHDNKIDDAAYAIMTIRSDINRVASNTIGSSVSTYEYYLSDDAGLRIENQEFSNDRIRGQDEANAVEIAKSGTVSVNDGDVIDTAAEPYTQTLTATTLTINSVTVTPPSEPGEEPESDTAKPLVIITSPKEDDSFPPGSIPVAGTAADNDGGSGIANVRLRVDDGKYKLATPKEEGDWSEWTIAPDVLETGAHRLVAKTIDNAGNPDWSVVNVKIEEAPVAEHDTTIPLIKITDPPSNTHVPLDASAIISGTAADNDGGSGIKTVQVRVDGGNYVTATPKEEGDWSEWTILINIETDGQHRIVSRATDNAGNHAWSTIYIYGDEKPDSSAPRIKIISPDEDQTISSGSVMVTGTAVDNDGGSGIANVQVRIDSGAYKQATPKTEGDWSEWSITIDIADEGNYRIVSRATDNAGNHAWDDVDVAAE